MSYRTHSLFHYTKSFDSLVGILNTGLFYPSFCLEDLSTSDYPNYCLGIPQVCFCDIPISRSQFLVDHYGEYAIAMDKSWGIKAGCNPVQYISNEVIIDKTIRSIDRLRELKEEIAKYKPSKNEKGELLFDLPYFFNAMEDGLAHNYLLGYMKKYMGEWQKKPYCNYEENEWRYVVKEGEDEIEWMTKEDYILWRGDPLKNKKPNPSEALIRHGLRFVITDIRHIVLKKDTEVLQFIDNVNKTSTLCGIDVAEEEKKLLLTKVTSFERISLDY